ncbi:MAG: hypothetical protein HYS53_03015 [Candidatus Aenigmarchaeota archaeon]|nr:hypothetical protein [Candidatus Aenigmarchaeota archaeon]
MSADSNISLADRIVKNWYVIIPFIAGLALLGQEINSYDAYNHMLFAKHYRNDWFSLIDAQTGGGLDMRSYPPLVFQLIAAISFITGYEWAYRLVFLVFWSVLAYYSSAFFQEYSGKKEVPFWLLYTAVFFGVGLLKSIFIFGQVTTVAGFAFGFMALYHYHRFLTNPGKKDLALSLTSLALVAFSHHFSLIVIAIVLFVITMMESGKIAAFSRRFAPVYFLVFTIVFVPTLWPFISAMLEKDAVPGIEIPHSSRDPLGSGFSYDQWILTTYGLSGIFVILPLMGRYLQAGDFRKHLKLYLIAAVLFLFSIGRATPINKIVFGGMEHWLTYDRFSLFSSLILTSIMASVAYGLVSHKAANKKAVLAVLMVFYLAANAGMLGHSREIFSIYPDSVKFENTTAVIVDFLNNEANKSYRYQTFGYGNLISNLFLLTENPTLDTNYFTGQKITWVREAGIAEIDTIKQFGRPDFIYTFLNRSSDYSVRYIITLDKTFSAALENHGWNRMKEADGIVFWENAAGVQSLENAVEKPRAENYLWGVVPLLTLIFLCALSKQKVNA